MNLTIFQNRYAPVKPECHYETDWETVAQVLIEHLDCPAKEDTALFNLWTFKVHEAKLNTWGQISRCADNAVGVWGLVLDFDAGLTISQAHQQFQQYEFVLYTTFRHLHDNVTHKFRIVLPFATMLAAEAFKAKKQSFQEAFPSVDPASFSASQAFYLHSGELSKAVAYHNKGKNLDPEDFESRPAEPIMYSSPLFNPKPRSEYTARVLAHLSKLSGLHYSDAMILANIVKGSGGEVEDYLGLCEYVFDTVSSHRKKPTTFLISEFERAYPQVNKLTVNEFLRGHGVAQLPSLCIK